MFRLRALAVLFVLVLPLLGGCGYHFAGQAQADGTEAASRLEPEFRKMNLVRVDNPTTESWIEPRMRSLIRDEFNRRRLVDWTERSKATSLLTVTVKRFVRSTAIAGQEDQSVKLSTSITVIFRVTRATDGRVLWESGDQSQTESYYSGDADGADMRVTDLIVRRLTDLMTENY